MLLSAWILVHAAVSLDIGVVAFPVVQTPAATKPSSRGATGNVQDPAGGQPAAKPGPNTAGQAPSNGKPAAKPASGGQASLGASFDAATGWPIATGIPAANTPAPAPTTATNEGEAAPAAGTPRQAGLHDGHRSGASGGGTPFEAFDGDRRAEPHRAPNRQEPAPAPTPDVPALASGTQLGSPLLEVYKSVGGVEAFRGLEGCVVWWRVSTFGEQGEAIGLREVTHTADCRYAERDRLEFNDGRIYGRVGAQVFAELRGMPWPTLNEPAGQDLMLFGLQLRAPWCFGDANLFMVVAKDFVDRSGERMLRIVLERRPPSAMEIVGPELDAKPRDRFELLCEPSSGRPRELVHRFACSLATRRVLLEDWREVENVRVPFRRVYVDEAMRTKTTLEILRLERQRTTERDFRLL